MMQTRFPYVSVLPAVTLSTKKRILFILEPVSKMFVTQLLGYKTDYTYIIKYAL